MNIKKIIAREGLIIIGGIVSIIPLSIIIEFFQPFYGRSIAISYLIIAYPLYLIIRFIIWAVKTLRNK